MLVMCGVVEACIALLVVSGMQEILMKSLGCSHRICPAMQTVEARTDFYNRTLGAIKAGAHFIQTSFPNATGLPAYAFPTSFSNTTVLATNYTVGYLLYTMHRRAPCTHPLSRVGMEDCMHQKPGILRRVGRLGDRQITASCIASML